MENSSQIPEDGYPIIWYEPNCELASKINRKENKEIDVFCEFQEAVSLTQSLKMSFLMIVPDNFDEQQLLEDFNRSFYARRLADFEEETILQGVGIQDEAAESFKIFLFYTDEDFESEVFVEEDVMKWDGKELARGFREELIFWERKRRGLEDADAVFERSEEPQRFYALENICDLWGFGEEEESFRESKRFCMRGLKKLVNKRKQEKKKLIYYVNLGECYFQLKDYDKALEYYTKACDIVEQIYGESHPNIANLYEGLGRICYRIKYYEKAIEYGLKMVEVRISIDGEMHSNVASLYGSIAFLYSCLKEYEKAAEYYPKAVAILKENNSEDLNNLYEKVVQTYQSLARLSYQQREYQKVIEYNLILIEIRKLIYGETHEEVASSYQALAIVYSRSGQYEKEVEYYLKAAEIRESRAVRPDYLLDILYSHVGDAYKKLKDFKKALRFYQKSLEIKKEMCGEISRWTAFSYYGIGLMFEGIREYQKAKKYLERALVIYKSLRKENPSDVNLRFEIGDTQYALNSCQKMTEYNVRIYDIKGI